MSATAGISLPGLVEQANTTLSHAKSPLHIDSACFTSSGIMCATASVLLQVDLDIIEATLPAKISGSWAILPFTMEPPNGQEISNQLIPSPILVDMIKHTQFVHNSPKANSRTFWINLVDLQRASTASSRALKHTPAPPSVNNAGNGATLLTHADAQPSAALSVWALITGTCIAL
ncbi:hypothetical protein P691DRAFT_765800 [Macrolepiota fuliginosa MF-IS2]|uniref:Uncharacterized protein n=1 Tax=Macrolepiota fuliginosa MF-IS2 TaxID=1400762 RepID=A0A9P5X1G6_9AGAR|nr:hypothetical protein P691DRAFT_765800 [Macrolepiota fuliginosa MF-IS2]